MLNQNQSNQLSLNRNRVFSSSSTFQNPLAQQNRLQTTSPAGFASSSRARDRGGNTLRRAKLLKPDTLDTEGTPGLRDAVSRRDRDFYRIEISEDNLFAGFIFSNLASRGAISTALLNQQGKVFSFDDQRTTNKINAGRLLTVSYRNLSVGTYYVRITTKRPTPGDYELLFFR